jgi:hypothetical protein
MESCLSPSIWKHVYFWQPQPGFLLLTLVGALGVLNEVPIGAVVKGVVIFFLPQVQLCADFPHLPPQLQAAVFA